MMKRKRAAKLRKWLKSEKFVLILDDVWQAFKIEEVGIPPLLDGQKLLLTSRKLQVCKAMQCESIEVKPLSDEEALDLFAKESKCQINDSGEWIGIVPSIVKECAGLPLAIVVTARKMIGVEEIWNWRETLRELQKPCEGENLEMDQKVYKVLKFSYDHLRNDIYRQCFLYCSLFPEDHTFKRDDLIDYWICMGIIESNSRQAELDKGNAILDELVHSSLLKKHFVQRKMHDVIRDMARIIAKVESQLQDPLESVQVLNTTMIKSFFNSAPHCSKLKTLVLEGNNIGEVSGCFFGNVQSLHVLAMIEVKSILDSITNLGNLKLLIITQCHNLERIPSIVGLERLRHLKISLNRKLKEILQGIERLVNLRVLDLSEIWCISGSLPNSVVKKLSHLQILNLSLSRVEVEPEAIISLEKLEILKVNFSNLQKFNSYVKSGHWRRLLDYEINCEKCNNEYQKKGMCLEAIRSAEECKGECGIFLADDIQYLGLVGWESPMFYVLKNPPFIHLRAICFTYYKNRNLFTVNLAQQFLHNVQQLSIHGSQELEEIIATEEEWVNVLLPNLKMLSLHDLSELRSIYRGRMDCPSLEFIRIGFCDKLERLPFCREKEGNKQYPTVKLVGCGHSSRMWWDSLQWDDPDDKSTYHPTFLNSITSR